MFEWLSFGVVGVRTVSELLDIRRARKLMLFLSILLVIANITVLFIVCSLGVLLLNFAMWLIICSLYFILRFVRPTKMSEQAINKYIKGKYGELGVDRYATSITLPCVDIDTATILVIFL